MAFVFILLFFSSFWRDGCHCYDQTGSREQGRWAMGDGSDSWNLISQTKHPAVDTHITVPVHTLEVAGIAN